MQHARFVGCRSRGPGPPPPIRRAISIMKRSPPPCSRGSINTRPPASHHRPFLGSLSTHLQLPPRHRISFPSILTSSSSSPPSPTTPPLHFSLPRKHATLRRYATETKTEQKEQEAKTGQGGGGGGKDDGGKGGDGDNNNDDDEEEEDEEAEKPDDPQRPETWEARKKRIGQFYDEVTKQRDEGDPSLQPRILMDQQRSLAERFPEWTAKQRAEQETMARYFYARYGPDKGRHAMFWWMRRAQNFATYEYAGFLREFADTKIEFDRNNDMRVFFKGIELKGTVLDEAINKKLKRADELHEAGLGHGGDDWNKSPRDAVLSPDASVHDLTWRLPFWALLWFVGIVVLHYFWQDIIEVYDKPRMRGYFADPIKLEPALRDVAGFVASMDIVHERLGRGSDISVDVSSFRLYHHGREVDFLFMIGGDLGVCAASVTFERINEDEGNFLGLSLTRRMSIRPRYAFVELPLDYYAEWDFVGTRKYSCHSPDEMVEIHEGTLQYTNFRAESWIKENMAYEEVQDEKIRETFEIDLQQAQARAMRLGEKESLQGLQKLADFTRRLYAVSDHVKGKSPHNPIAEDNFEALQGKYLRQLRAERAAEQRNFRGTQQYEQDEDERLQREAKERALQRRAHLFWQARAKEVTADYEGRLARERASEGKEGRIGGVRVVQRQATIPGAHQPEHPHTNQPV